MRHVFGVALSMMLVAVILVWTFCSIATHITSRTFLNHVIEAAPLEVLGEHLWSTRAAPALDALRMAPQQQAALKQLMFEGVLNYHELRTQLKANVAQLTMWLNSNEPLDALRLSLNLQPVNEGIRTQLVPFLEQQGLHPTAARRIASAPLLPETLSLLGNEKTLSAETHDAFLNARSAYLQLRSIRLIGIAILLLLLLCLALLFRKKLWMAFTYAGAAAAAASIPLMGTGLLGINAVIWTMAHDGTLAPGGWSAQDQELLQQFALTVLGSLKTVVLLWGVVYLLAAALLLVIALVLKKRIRYNGTTI